MAKQDINVGITPNDGTGDPLRTAFGKANQNFTELYSIAASLPATYQPLRAVLTNTTASFTTTQEVKLGHITVNGPVNLDTVATAVAGLGTAAQAATTDFATSAQGALADSAVQPGSLAAVAFSGAYSDVSGTPTLATVATTGAYADISGTPTLGTAAAAATTDFATSAQGALADTAVQPGALATVATSGAYSDLSGTPSLAAVATSGAYADLSGTPSLATVATSGSYNDLSNLPALFSGDYTDLSNKPTLGTAAALDVGTGANNVVQLDGSGALPAVDGSALTGISAGGGAESISPFLLMGA